MISTLDEILRCICEVKPLFNNLGARIEDREGSGSLFLQENLRKKGKRINR